MPQSAEAVAAAPSPELPQAAQSSSAFPSWAFRLEAGLAGATGNTENFNLRFGAGAQRKTESIETKFDLYYLYASENGRRSQNRGEFNARNDWLMPGTPWSVFALGKVEYDEFQEWDWRLSGFVGPGYAFIDNGRTLLRGRVGAGGNREFGSPQNEFTPEALAGVDFDFKITDRQKFALTYDYIPSLSDFPEFRTNGRASWEMLIDPKLNMSLRIGAEHRYQSNPGDGFRHNDLDYFATFVIGF
jgi:putative salt-induced outer membrane protein YdiY